MSDSLTSRLQLLYERIPPKVLTLPESDWAAKPAPDKWSKKEVLGHLIDSAINNHTRFIRLQIEPQPLVIKKYAQDDWVRLHQYQEWTTEVLVRCWQSHQHQIIVLMEVAPEESLYKLCDIGNGELKTMQWLYQDYVAHLEHHLQQIIDYDF
ncbi:DinB family protein [Tunicatimonas pelagia]|uniref:DinB family protein n=1 Tax=Tunicatimonas pelagia TaxID=931531 RepID=UPI002664FF48|nr:DinB family protein [Tunicatimonas pelagia]WKN40669.1 DinB family protein [Tunicatimonas pelagia]